MDCQHARMLLAFSRKPGELDSAETDSLREHLVDCRGCQVVERSDRDADAVIGKAMHAVAIPPGLKAGILQRVRRQRSRRTWVAGAVAAAALVLLAVGVSALVWMSSPPPFDPDQFYESQTAKARSTREDVEQWFRQEGIAMAAPANFNYDLLETYGVEDIQGRKIPYLVFVTRENARHPGGEVAYVYVFPSDVANREPSFTNDRRYEILPPNPGDPRFHYVIIYTGISRDPFLNKPDA